MAKLPSAHAAKHKLARQPSLFSKRSNRPAALRLAGIRCKVIPTEQLKVISSARQQGQSTDTEGFVLEIEQITGRHIERAVQKYRGSG